MKLNVFLFWFLFEATSSAPTNYNEACTNINKLGFANSNMKCTERPIMKKVQKKMGDDCPHDQWTEIQIITNNMGDLDAAKETIIKICEDSKPASCTTIESLDFENIGSCDSDTIGKRVKAALGDDCPHGKGKEIKLLAGMKDIDAATEFLIEQCESLQEDDDDDDDDNVDDDDSADDEQPRCTDEELDLEINGCDYSSIVEAISEEISDDCNHSVETEIQIITGTSSDEDAKEYIRGMCSSAWDTVDTTNYESINKDFTDDFMNEYTDGGGYLNTETGNFQGEQSEKYKTSQQSLLAGENIDTYYEADENGASSSRLDVTFENLQNCELQSIMCCFGRDRQSNDNNGNCKTNRCDNADPADNSNLCYTEPSHTPYPGMYEEGNIHCHGLAWAEDENDIISQLKYNNFFYVSMYDHMYTRGYVQNLIFHDGDNDDYVPMCSCIENMPPVSRSDCTQLDVSITFRLFVSSTSGVLEAESLNDLDIEFNACEGFDYSNPNRQDNNDLSSYAVRLVAEGKMSTATQFGMYKTLVGYANPNSNSNEAACKADYEDLTGEDYPRWCCSNDYKTCHAQPFCNIGPGACRECDGLWIRDDYCPDNGIPLWEQCTNNEDGCCGPAKCEGDNFYKQCTPPE